jgi:hypothetical protein
MWESEGWVVGSAHPTNQRKTSVQQHSGQFLIGNGGMQVSALFPSGLANEESRVSALVRKSVRTIGSINCNASSNLKCINLAQNRCQPLRPLPKQRTLYDSVTPGLVASYRSCDRSNTTSGFEQVMHFILELAQYIQINIFIFVFNIHFLDLFESLESEFYGDFYGLDKKQIDDLLTASKL